MSNPAGTLAAKNRNPLNLRPIPASAGGPWKGQVSASTNATSGTFAVFDNNVSGVRAAVVNMRTIMRPEQYVIKKVIDGRIVPVSVGRTIERLIYAWAPPDEPMGGNHTEAYLQSVMAAAGITDRDFDMGWMITATADDDDPVLARIVLAMNRVEAGGSTIDEATARAGIQAALGVPAGYKRTGNGNVVRADVNQSSIVNKANVGELITIGGTAVAATAPVATSFLAADWRVAVVFAVLIFGIGWLIKTYFRGIRERRVEMHELEIA